MKKIFFIIIAFTLFIIKVSAQDLANYNLYMQNYYPFNPAYTYDNSCYSLYFNTHQQWLGFEGAPQTYTFGVHGPIFKNSGIGISIEQKKTGLLSNFTGYANYSYRAVFSEDHYLGMGISLGFINDKVNSNLVDPAYINDPNLLNDSYKKTSISANFGIGYFIKNFELQIIMPQLLQRKDMNFYTLGILSYNYRLNNQFILKPSVLARGVNISPYQVEGNLAVEYNNLLWAQAGYRTSNSMIFSAGCKIKGIGVGYAYQADFGTLGMLSNGTHEVQLMYNFGEQICNKKPSKMQATGTIKNEYTNEPLNDAEVIIYNNDGEELCRTKTDKNGFYKTCDLKLGESYKIEVVKNDYTSKTELLSIGEDETSKTMDLNLKPLKTVLKLNIVPPFADITITDENGSVVYTGKADENGNFETDVVYGKTYKIDVKADGYEPKTENYFVKPGNTDNIVSVNLKQYKNLTALIKNKDTNEPLTAKVVIKDAQGKIIDSKEVTGEYKITLLPGNYKIEVTSDQIIPVKEDLEIKADTEKEYSISIEAKVLSKDKTFNLGSVNFETGKSIIKPESYYILDELVKIMNENPEMKIQIEGHTDNVGNPASNLKLSQDRANACMKYAIDKGISADRLKAVGYGQTKPIVPNDTPENKAKNRRTEFKIIE